MAKSPSRKKYKCVYGTNQYGCCNKKPSVRKTKRCLEASKRRRSPCKYGEDENGCCNKRPTVKYRKSCRKSRKIRKSIESRIKLEKMLNDKHLIKKIIKSLTKSKRKSRKPQHVNRPSMQASSGLEKLKASIGHLSPFKKRKQRKIKLAKIAEREKAKRIKPRYDSIKDKAEKAAEKAAVKRTLEEYERIKKEAEKIERLEKELNRIKQSK
jgi:hypothetical protein